MILVSFGLLNAFKEQDRDQLNFKMHKTTEQDNDSVLIKQ